MTNFNETPNRPSYDKLWAILIGVFQSPGILYRWVYNQNGYDYWECSCCKAEVPDHFYVEEIEHDEKCPFVSLNLNNEERAAVVARREQAKIEKQERAQRQAEELQRQIRFDEFQKLKAEFEPADKE